MKSAGPVRLGILRRPFALAGLVALAAGVAACDGRDDGSTPEAAVRSLIAAARSGDRAAVYGRFGPRTRARVEGLLNAARRTGGTRALKPEDLVTAGWLPPAWEPVGMRLVRKEGEEAEVEVYSTAGDRQSLVTVREGKTWKVELPFR
jgi:hypothetical protein